MAKKATTIVLFFVVLFLLGSTIYVSIILTSEDGNSPTRARQTKASEIDDTQQAVDDPLASDEAAPQEPDFEENADGDTSLVEQTATETEDGAPVDPNDPDATEEDLLAYANPSPTGAAGSTTDADEPETSPSPARVPQDGTISLTTSLEDDATLPETGKGTTITPTKAPTTVPVTTAPTQMVTPVSLPVAGNFGFTVVAAVTAGATIVAALFL